MAALTIESARAAREEAERLRATMFRLRASVRASNRVARTRKEQMAAAVAAREQRRLAMSTASPWSGLEWRREDPELERALVQID